MVGLVRRCKRCLIDGSVEHQATCYGCHEPNGAVENTFTQFYPTALGVAEKYGIGDFSVERDKQRTYEIYTDIVKGKLQALPGAVEFVGLCKDSGLKIALATSTDYVKMMANLREIGLDQGVFDALVNGLDVERRKPFPDLFLEAARRIQADPKHCWVVEDSVGGVQAAKTAGMYCCALLTTFGEADLRNAGADLIIGDLSKAKLSQLYQIFSK